MVRIAWLVAAVGAVGLSAYALAGGGGARQSYGAWQYNKDKNYYYREYKYKEKPTDTNYQHQYCVYYKDDSKVNNKWVYFYNPKTEKYWARYPTTNNDQYKKYAEKRQEAWSELPAQYQQKDIYQIDKKSWPAPKTDYCPSVPGSDDKTPMLAPPSDLP